MPEGDTLHIIATRLRALVEGELLVAAELCTGDFGFRGARDRHRGLQVVASLRGRRITAVRSVGKHLVIEVDDGRAVRLHLGMSGSVHRYARGEAWRRPRWEARLCLCTAELEIVCFRPSQVALGPTWADSVIDRLGPDLLERDIDLDAVLRRAFEREDDPICDVLLDQRIAAGVGNLYKCEALFVERTNPWSRVGDLRPARVRAIYATARLLLMAGSGGGPRATRPQVAHSEAPLERFWVYGRSGRACFECGRTVQVARGTRSLRSTWWCDGCQGTGHPSDTGRRAPRGGEPGEAGPRCPE